MNHEFVFLMLLLIFTVAGDSLSDVSIIPTSYEIRTTVNCSINIMTKNLVPLGGSIKIVFPSIFEIPDSSIFCSVKTVSNSCKCAFISNSLSITSCFPSTNELIFISLFDLPNPAYAETGDFEVFTYSANEAVLDSKTSGISATYNPVTMLSGTIVPITSISSQNSVWNVSLTVSYQLYSGNYINIPMPDGYCNGLIACSGLNNTCFCNNGVSVILYQNIIGQCNILIDGILNPISTAVVDGFMIKTGSNLGIIEKSLSLTVQVEQGCEMTVNLTISNPQVFENSPYYVDFICNGPIPKNSNIVIMFPKESIVQDNCLVQGLFGMSDSLDYTINNNTISIYSAIVEYQAIHSVIAINFTNLINPSSVQLSSLGIIYVTNNDGVVCQGNFSVLSTIGSLAFSVIPNSYTINELTYYELFISTFHYFFEASLIIQFPEEISIKNSFCSFCKIDTNIKIFNITGKSLNITIFNVTNPSFTMPTSNFLVTSYTDSSFAYPIETNTSINIFPTIGKMNVLVLPSS